MEVVVLPTGDEEDAAESSTIFVKNLAFATSDAALQVRLVLVLFREASSAC